MMDTAKICRSFFASFSFTLFLQDKRKQREKYNYHDLGYVAFSQQLWHDKRGGSVFLCLSYIFLFLNPVYALARNRAKCTHITLMTILSFCLSVYLSVYLSLSKYSSVYLSNLSFHLSI